MVAAPVPAVEKMNSPTVESVSRLQLMSRLLAGQGGSSEKLESLLAEIAAVFDLVEAGVRWPIAGTAQFFAVGGRATEPESLSRDIVERLNKARSVEEALIDPHEPRQLLVPLMLESRRNGAFWGLGRGPIDDDNGHALIVVSQCLSRHPALVEKLGPPLDSVRITQRLHDAATVGGKIAHDFDNVFTGVVGFGEMVQGMLEPGGLPHQYVSEIISAGNRGISFTQQLHQLSRSATVRPTPSSVGAMLTREEGRLKKLPNLSAKLQLAAPPDLPPVAIDAGALQQAIGHLLDNAVEASPPGGAVRVGAALVELAEAEAREYLGAVSAGPFVELRISDEGGGVRDDQRKKLFVEPFFTTKVRHRGLGLAVVLRILTAHRGGVRYEAAGRGSIFHVVLPLAAARAFE